MFDQCTHPQVKSCPDPEEKDKSPYGVDPVFLPSSASYNDKLSASSYYNMSDPNVADIDKGYPYGFRYRTAGEEVILMLYPV